MWSQKTQGFCIADFATLSEEGRWRSKILLLFKTDKRNSWLTVSNQIVKSLSLCYKKSYYFNMVQPIDLIFCKVIEMIEQNIFNRADFSFRS